MADSVPAPPVRDKTSNARGDEKAAWPRRHPWRAAPRRGRHLQEVRAGDKLLELAVYSIHDDEVLVRVVRMSHRADAYG
jgi:hypothetical protein